VLASGDRDPDRAAVIAAVAHRRRDSRRVERGDRLGGLGHVLAKQRPERAVVGLHLVLAELLGGRDKAHPPDVQLLTDDVRQPFDRRALALVGHHHCLAQWLAHLDLGLAACPQTEAHRLTRERHRLLERLLTRRQGVTGGEVAQVHARERAVEVVVDLIGDERAERGEQL
jgi:hypothetical protein